MKRDVLAALIVAAGGLGACTTAPERPDARATIAPAWLTPLPHGGTAAALAQWWQQFDDPMLSRLVAAAQGASPTVASAGARIADARARRVQAGAALLPSLDASANIARGRQDVSIPSGTSAGIGVQAGWEIDVFGRNRAARDAAEARLAGAESTWHDARVSVAAETANQYIELRACEARLAQARLDADSRSETARLTDLSMQSGFESRANAALTRASAAQGLFAVKQQGQQCEQAVKALVALTGIAEPALRGELAGTATRLPEPAAIVVPAVPAAALAQRPDVDARARDVAAASADIDEARAARLPRITLAGSIGAARFESGGGSLDGSTWSIGPVAVTLPIFDGGTRRANVEAARARYDEATSRYTATLRVAVRDVESALLALQGTADRSADAQIAADNFEVSFRATEARYKSGFGTLFELEDARRSALAAQNTLIDLRRERVAAWIGLYRALGGGWTELADARTAATSAPRSPSP